jgi:hypothetical protein
MPELLCCPTENTNTIDHIQKQKNDKKLKKPINPPLE